MRSSWETIEWLPQKNLTFVENLNEEPEFDAIYFQIDFELKQ